MFGGHCGNCHVRIATCVHEIIPRSKLPGEWNDIDNQIPLCSDCHEWVHSVAGTSEAAPIFIYNRKFHLDFYGGSAPADSAN